VYRLFAFSCRVVRHRICRPRGDILHETYRPNARFGAGMNGIEESLLDLVRVGESPLYFAYRHGPRRSARGLMVSHRVIDGPGRLDDQAHASQANWCDAATSERFHDRR
jgi:hypothetical protein